MQPEEVDAMLSGYLENLGRYQHLEQAVKGLEKRFNAIRNAALANEAGPGGQRLDGMPHASGVGNPVARVACRFADGDYPDYVKPYKAELDRALVQKDAAENRVHYVDAWMGGLNDIESWVVKNQVIGGLPWQETMRKYSADFGVACSKDRLKRIRDKALDKIYRMAE